MKMNDAEIIIIGAGAAGLMAGNILSGQKIKTIVFEARDRIGGRIESFQFPGDSHIYEAGAEFVHGKLPHTLNILNAANISMRTAGGKMISLANDETQNRDAEPAHWQLLEKYLTELKNDITVKEFIETYCRGDEFEGIRNRVRGFVEGYDTADTSIASTFAFRDEWMHMGEEGQYRINGGYGKMIEYLAGEINQNGNSIVLNSTIKKIEWKKNNVSVTGENGKIYSAEKLIVAVPFGVLKTESVHPAHIKIEPAIPELIHAVESTGFGDVIKLLISFREMFWEYEKYKLQGLGFLFTGNKIPTWWTQAPDRSNLLVGWLGGPNAALYKNEPDEIIYRDAIESLSLAFEISPDHLNSLVENFRIANWSADTFACGSYTFETPSSHAVVQPLLQGIEETIYFAGDSVYQGKSVGMVEAALHSGLNAAEMILKSRGN